MSHSIIELNGDPLRLNELRRPFIVWDLDNCLSNDEWRISKIDWSTLDPDVRYREYHETCLADAPGNHHYFYANYNRSPIFVTARPVRMRPVTETWLRHHFALPARGILAMRPAGDHAASPKLKVRLLGEVMKAYEIRPDDIMLAYDDRLDILGAYEEAFGIRSRRLSIHNTPYLPSKAQHEDY